MLSDAEYNRLTKLALPELTDEQINAIRAYNRKYKLWFNAAKYDQEASRRFTRREIKRMVNGTNDYPHAKD